MPELFIRIRVNEKSEPELLAEDRIKVREFYSKNSGQNIEWILRTEEEARTLKTNRYYWGLILPTFCPDLFGTPEDVHEYYSKKFLSQEDVIDIRDDVFGLFLAKITKYASRTRNTIKKEQLDDYTFKITWVRSTAILTKKMMKDYLDKVMLDGNEQGLEFESLEGFDPYKNQR
jgi:hypothetical protein